MIKDTNPAELNKKLADNLKKIIKKPEWAPFVKTGSFKEKPPMDPDWWYTRAASIFRQIYIKGPIGVAKLSTIYGGKKNRGYKPERFYTGSTNIIRTILQDFEKVNLIKQGQRGVHKGRILTPQGQAFLASAIKEMTAPHKPTKEKAKK